LLLLLLLLLLSFFIGVVTFDYLSSSVGGGTSLVN